MKHKSVKWLATGIALSALLFAIAGAVLAANYVQVVNFSGYAEGTEAEAIHEHWVTFDVLEGIVRVAADIGFLRLNYEYDYNPSTLMINLDHEATAISFDYMTYGNCYYPVNLVELYSHGSLVASTVIDTCTSGTFSASGTFDAVKLDAGRITNAEAMDINNIALTFNITKEDCKNGGWEALGYLNQGQCVSDTNH